MQPQDSVQAYSPLPASAKFPAQVSTKVTDIDLSFGTVFKFTLYFMISSFIIGIVLWIIAAVILLAVGVSLT